MQPTKMKRVFLAVLLFVLPAFSQEKSEPKPEQQSAATMPLSQEDQAAIATLQKDLELGQAKLEAAQRQVENVRLRAEILFGQCEKKAPEGYTFDRQQAQYVKVKAPKEKAEPKGPKTK